MPRQPRHEIDEPTEPETLPLRSAPRMGADASILMLTGLFAVLGGLALSAVPKFAISWKLTQVAEGFAQLGLFGGTFLMGGLVLVAMGVIRRGQYQLDRELWRNRFDNDTQDLLTSEMTGLRDDMDAIGHAIGSLSQGMEAAVQRLAALGQHEGNEESSRDAIFRVAASLDQLGAHLEGQFGAGTNELAERLESLRAAHDASLEAIAGVRESLEAQRESATAERREQLDEIADLLERRDDAATVPASIAADAEPPIDPTPQVSAPIATSEPTTDPLEALDAPLPGASSFDLAAKIQADASGADSTGERSELSNAELRNALDRLRQEDGAA